jgi:hypothetical protein
VEHWRGAVLTVRPQQELLNLTHEPCTHTDTQ